MVDEWKETAEKNSYHTVATFGMMTVSWGVRTVKVFVFTAINLSAFVSTHTFGNDVIFKSAYTSQVAHHVATRSPLRPSPTGWDASPWQGWSVLPRNTARCPRPGPTSFPERGLWERGWGRARTERWANKPLGHRASTEHHFIFNTKTGIQRRLETPDLVITYFLFSIFFSESGDQSLLHVKDIFLLYTAVQWRPWFLLKKTALLTGVIWWGPPRLTGIF